MSRNTHRHRAQRPVFVDASGRRQQTLKVAGILGVLVAVGYLCVLVSAVLGGPTIHSAFLPLPAVPSPAAVAAPHLKPVPMGSSTSAPAQPSYVAVVAPVVRPTTSTALPTSTSVPTSTAAATTTAKGKPTDLPTPANRPTKTTR